MSLFPTAPSSATASPTVSTTSPARRFGAGLPLLALSLVLIVALGLAGCEMRTGSERPEKSAAPAAESAPVPAAAAAPAPALGDPAEVVSRLISGVFAAESAERLEPLVDPALLPSLHKVLDAVQASKAQGDVVSLDAIRPDDVRITASVTVKTTVTQSGETREDTATVPLEFVDGHWRVTSLNF